MPAPDDPMKRNSADGILESVGKGGAIRLATLTTLLDLFAQKRPADHVHIAVEILQKGSALLKTIDNEDDAQETIRRLRNLPDVT